jgi:hypothetical protein
MAIECKASSFSMESTTATQLRKLLHYCSQSNVAFGVNAPAIVSYLLPDSESAAQRRTLKLASEELRDKNLAFSESATIGILFSNHGLEARFISVEDPVERPWLGLARRDWCVYPGEGPVRPLYFIPFDPASASEQSAEERGYCEKLLTERILTAAVSEIGRAIIPDNVTLISRDLVGTATYNVSDRWAKSDSVQLETRVTNILASIFRRAKVAAEKVERKQDGLELFLASEKDRSAMIDILLKAQPAAISPALHDPQQDAAEPGSGGWLDASGDDPSE